jgi:hypothetical protein
MTSRHASDVPIGASVSSASSIEAIDRRWVTSADFLAEVHAG